MSTVKRASVVTDGSKPTSMRATIIKAATPPKVVQSESSPIKTSPIKSISKTDRAIKTVLVTPKVDVYPTKIPPTSLSKSFKSVPPATSSSSAGATAMLGNTKKKTSAIKPKKALIDTKRATVLTKKESPGVKSETISKLMNEIEIESDLSNSDDDWRSRKPPTPMKHKPASKRPIKKPSLSPTSGLLMRLSPRSDDFTSDEGEEMTSEILRDALKNEIEALKEPKRSQGILSLQQDGSSEEMEFLQLFKDRMKNAKGNKSNATLNKKSPARKPLLTKLGIPLSDSESDDDNDDDDEDTYDEYIPSLSDKDAENCVMKSLGSKASMSKVMQAIKETEMLLSQTGKISRPTKSGGFHKSEIRRAKSVNTSSSRGSKKATCTGRPSTIKTNTDSHFRKSSK